MSSTLFTSLSKNPRRKKEEMKHCERCMKTMWFWQTNDIDNDYYSSSEESTGHQNKIMYYHWNCRYPKIKW